MAGSLLGDYKILREQVESAITDILATDIAEEAKIVIADEAQSKVYDAYSPVFFSRRYSLQNESNMHEEVSGLTLTVKSESGLQNFFGGNASGNVAEIVESGASNYHMPFPRPYHNSAEQRLQSEGVADGLLESGLKSRGF